MTKFAVAAFQADIDALTRCFLPNGWLRDVLVFTWNTRSLEGRSKIAAYLKHTLPLLHLSNFKLDTEDGLKPEPSLEKGLATGFTFETLDRRGHGYAYLLPDGDQWRALSVFMMVTDIKGHEEKGHELGTYNGHTLSWEEVHGARREAIEKEPYVIIGKTITSARRSAIGTLTCGCSRGWPDGFAHCGKVQTNEHPCTGSGEARGGR